MPKHFLKLAVACASAGIAHTALALNPVVASADLFQVTEDAYVLQSFDRSGKVIEVPAKATPQDRYFFANCHDADHCYSNGIPAGAVVFKAPSGFKSTANSRFPRVELRATHNFQNGDTFTNVQAGTAFIIAAPRTNSIIFAQIHGEKTGGSEMFKLRWVNGEIVAGVKISFGDHEVRQPLIAAAIDDRIAYTLQAVGVESAIKVTITVAVNGAAPVSQTFTYPKANGWADCGLYFKAGNYNQDAMSDNTEAVVAYSDLHVSYR